MDDDVDFNNELDVVTSTEENEDKRKFLNALIAGENVLLRED